MKGFYITYETITTQSAEYGEAEDRGWYDGGFHFDVEDKPPEPALQFDPEFDYDPDDHGSESDAAVAWAVKTLQDIGSLEYSGNGWWSDADGNTDIATGEVERRSYHPHGFTDEELDQIANEV